MSCRALLTWFSLLISLIPVCHRQTDRQTALSHDDNYHHLLCHRPPRSLFVKPPLSILWHLFDLAHVLVFHFRPCLISLIFPNKYFFSFYALSSLLHCTCRVKFDCICYIVMYCIVCSVFEVYWVRLNVCYWYERPSTRTRSSRYRVTNCDIRSVCLVNIVLRSWREM